MNTYRITEENGLMVEEYSTQDLNGRTAALDVARALSEFTEKTYFVINLDTKFRWVAEGGKIQPLGPISDDITRAGFDDD